MKVHELRKLLESAPDEAEVVIPGGDHSYRAVYSAVPTTGLRAGRCNWTEDHGEALTPEANWGKRLPIFLLG